MAVRFELPRSLFADRERPVAAMDGISVSAFRYDSGIEALRVRNRRGEIVVLPFKGHQVWSARFDGRDLTMRTMFEQPVPTTDYLGTYGAFFIHCGLTAIGAPGPGDRHPLHGELPNAPFQAAWLDMDEAAGTVVLGASYRHTVAFQANYRATSEIELGRDAAVVEIRLAAENLKRTPMDLMYMAHANFRPVDHGELIYSAPYEPGSVRVRADLPPFIATPSGYREFLDDLARDPTAHHVLKPGMAFDPEVVFTLDMRADAEGWAHALQRHPDGTADYLAHRPDQVPIAIRWISRTPDQDALGFSLPATSEVEGYTAEKRKGQYVALPAGATWRVAVRLGALTAAEAADRAARIDRTMGR